MKTPANTKKLLLASGRAWVSSVALLSFFLLPAAQLSAQGDNPDEASAIVGTSTDLEDLIVTVAWQDSVVDDWFEIAVFDENDLQIAEQPVWPSPGERVLVTFDNLFHNVPESGFQFSATVRDVAGRDVSPRHAFRVVLECPPAMELCQWSTQDGLHTNALAISEPLMTALDALEARRSSDLLADVLEERPDLRGPVFSLAAQLDQLDQQLGLEDECACAWYHSSTQNPKQRQRQRSGPGLSLDGSSGSEQEEVRGRGAAALAAGQALYSPLSHLVSASGMSQQTLKLLCWKTPEWIEVAHLPLVASPDAPLRMIRFPIMVPCPDACRGAVESSASIDYEFSTRVREPASGWGIDALAIADAALTRDDGVNHPPKKNTWQDWLQWQPGTTFLKKEGPIQIPSEAVVDDNVRQMTTTLSGKATVTFRAKEDDAWSYAMACVKGTGLRVKGHADCALLPDREAELSASGGGFRTDDCGEPLIEPWGD